MKKRNKIAICLALSGMVLASKSPNKPVKQNIFNQIAFASNPSLIKGYRGGFITNTVSLDHEFISSIKSVEVNGSSWVEDSSNNRPNKRGIYYLSKGENGDEFSIVFTKLDKSDKVVIKSDKKILSFTINDPQDSWGDSLIDKNSITEDNIGSSSKKEDIPKEKEKKTSKNYILSSEGGFLNNTIRLDASFVNSIKSIEINNQNYKEVSNSRPSSGQIYYLIKGDDGPNQFGVRFPKLNKNDKIFIKTDKESLSFIIKDPDSINGIIDDDSINVQELTETPPKKEGDPNTGKDILDKELSFTYVSKAFGHNILKLTSGTKFDKKKLEKIIINGKDQTEVSSPISIFGKGNYAFSSDGELCIESLNDNDSLSITYDGKEYNYLYKDKKLIDNNDKKDVTYQIRLVGKFDNLLVGQTKIDGFSGGSVSVSYNPNAVSVEYTDKENPGENDWKKLENRGNDFKTVKAVIVDTDTGIEADFANGSIILGGSPTKAGTFKIKIQAEDIRGKKVESNEVEVEVHNLGEQSLEELLSKAKFIQTQDKKYMWEMSPWKITKFNNSDSLVNVPKDLKAWFGSHQSGTYGELGIETLGEPSQTLVVGDGANLTFKNMKILGSVKIIVKNGGILNLDDSVVFGKIEVSNGGKLNVNYNPHKKEITTGASIWGQVVLKDGAILGHSSIYSNTNYASQGKLVNINSQPVIRVEGKARIEGEVSIRGDEQATKGESGQPALEIGPKGELDISENSSLNLFGGGAKPLTSVGGDALKLNGGKITGKGSLVAVAGAGYGKKGGFGISGHGTISVAKAYIRGGNSSSNPSKAVESDQIKFEGTKGVAIDGKVPTNYDPVIPEDYWNVTQRISSDILDKINKTLEENKDAPINKNQTPNTGNNQPENSDNKKGHYSYPNYHFSNLANNLLNENRIPKFDKEKYDKLKKAYERSTIVSKAAALLLEKCPNKTKNIRKELLHLIEHSEKLRKEAEIILKKNESWF